MRTMKRLTLVAGVAALAACGGDSSSAPGGAPETQASLIYSYPIQEQNEVPTPAPLVLRFSESIEGQGLENDIQLRSNGQAVDTEARFADNGRSLILTPEGGLEFHTNYVIDFPDDFPFSSEDITFTTKAAQEGPRANVVSAEGMTLTRILPSDGEYDPVMDFSTLRFQFSQPIDRETVRYGTSPDDTVILVDANEQPVPAWVVVDGPYLTIDPKEDLTPGDEYRIRFGNNEVKSVYGESFTYQMNDLRYRFRPASSLAQGAGPDERPLPLVQRITTPEDQIERTGDGNSPLTGEPINEIPVNAVLLGGQSTTFMARTQQEGDVLGDLAYLPNWPSVSPLRIRRGTLLTGSEIDVKIGGEVDAGFDSGTVNVQFLSDATGYLIPNIYDPEGPRMVRLFLDVAMSTSDPTANGGVTQNITHLELIGTVSTDTEEGVIDINAVGVVEPVILGQEQAYGTLSFQLQTYRDQTEQLVDDVRYDSKDLTPPELQSWVPGEHTDLHKPGDSIIFNFDEAIEPASINDNVRLYHNDNPVDIEYYADGAALVIKPNVVHEKTEFGTKVTATSSLRYSPVDAPNLYRVEIDAVADLAGNTFSGITKQFELSELIELENLSQFLTEPTLQNRLVDMRETEHAPLILSAYPGYPCALMQEYYDDRGQGDVDITRKLDSDHNQAGLCAGSFTGIYDGTERDRQPADDVIPVMELPANHPIILSFSKNIDAESVVLGQTFRVDKVRDDGSYVSSVSGSVSVDARKITFYPDGPWDTGSLYKYKLLSSGYEMGLLGASSNGILLLTADPDGYNCGVDAVCDESGLPLQTQVLGPVTISTYNEDGAPTGNDRDYEVLFGYTELQAGGPDFAQFFRGAEKSNGVLQYLTTQPVSDVNGNFMSEVSNTGTVPYPSQPGMNVGLFDFPHEESFPQEAMEGSAPGRYPEYDPGGLKPIKNSAKLLSRFSNQEWDDEFFAGGNGRIIGLNFGCGYDQTSLGPLACPKHKFTYLISSMVAEVTDVTDESGNIKVKLWPSMVVGTSMSLYAPTQIIPGFYFVTPGETGKQILRMRYGSDGSARNEPVIGWISSEDGRPVMKAEIDLYVDTPFAPDWALGAPAQPVNMHSYPISMKLKGDIEFLDDGRMMVEQYNIEPVDIEMLIHGASGGGVIGYADLFIPEYGSRLNFLSQPIK